MFSIGSQSSALIVESLVGVSSSVTRQCAGIGSGAGALGFAFAAGLTGGVKIPAATASALVIVAFSSAKPVSVSQVLADMLEATAAAAKSVNMACSPWSCWSTNDFVNFCFTTGRIAGSKAGATNPRAELIPVSTPNGTGFCCDLFVQSVS